MFYFSQPRNQTRKLKTSQPSEKTRYNSKIFYKICPIFDNKEENVSSRSVLLTVSQIILQSFNYFEPKILILLPFCFSFKIRKAQPSHLAERHTTDTERRQQCTLICLMFYFSQPRNQNQTSKKKKRRVERTRYNLKLFYKICSIFNNKE